MTRFTVVINAGGKSSRMGTDKALVEIGGRTMIEQIVDQTRGLGADTVVVTNTPERYAFLGLPTVADLLPDKGALGGLYTAVHAATQPYAVVLACDMPFVNRPLLEHMMSLAAEVDAVIPRLTPAPPHPPAGGAPAGAGEGAEAEPFRAVYAKACLDPIRRALEAGKMRIISFFPEVRLRWIEEDEIRKFDPELMTFMNCNTVEELDVVRQRWKRLHP
jgi:molybdopterin-guanine dinucleotide biosynthesis protein A